MVSKPRREEWLKTKNGIVIYISDTDRNNFPISLPDGREWYGGITIGRLISFFIALHDGKSLNVAAKVFEG